VQIGKRILFVAPSAYPLGGVAEWLDYTMAGLTEQGWECTLGLTSGRFHDAERYLAVHPWHSVERIPNPTGSSEGRVKALQSAISSTRPDILAVINLVDAYEAVRRMRLAGSASPRIATTLHGLQADLLADLRAHRDVIDAVVVTNELTRLLAEEALGGTGRVFYAPYGVPQQPARPLREPVPGRLALLYSGRLEESQKRITDLAKLLVEVRKSGVDATLSIAGDGPDASSLHAAVQACGLGDFVRHLGVLDQESLAREYQTHDALVVTSSWETGPIVAWEAMSHGLPVLSSRYVGSGRECALVDGSNCLLFPLGDMAAAAMKALMLLDGGVRAKLVNGGLALVSDRYSRDASVRQWTSALEQVMFLPRLGAASPSNKTPPSGRLDRLLGTVAGERIRAMLGLAFAHSSAGSEWPHTSHANVDQEFWLARAGELDVVQ
jgi:glycosyltransferase involved in cell wall biosynthesis